MAWQPFELGMVDASAFEAALVFLGGLAVLGDFGGVGEIATGAPLGAA